MMASSKPQLFYSYLHGDEQFRNHLEIQLALLNRQGLIGGWHSRELVSDQEWNSTIDANLESAEVIVFLVSADFLASAYCFGREVKRAVEKHESGEARVIPIILHPADWRATPFGQLQALPRGGKAVTTWFPQAEAWTDVAMGIQTVVQGLIPSPIETFTSSQNPHKLRVFLAHNLGDQSRVRDLYYQLQKEAFIEPWMDEQELLPGEDGDLAIKRAIRSADVILVCLSKKSITEAGHLQRELRYTLEMVSDQPLEGNNLIPVRLESLVMPKELIAAQEVNLSTKQGYDRLMQALRTRSAKLLAPAYQRLELVLQLLRNNLRIGGRKQTLEQKQYIATILTDFSSLLGLEVRKNKDLDDVILYDLNITAAVESVNLPKIVTLAVITEMEISSDVVDRLRRLLVSGQIKFEMQIAFLLSFCSDDDLDSTKKLIAEELQPHAFDLIVFGPNDLLRLVTAEQPQQAFRRFVLSRVDLSLVAPYKITGVTPSNAFFGREHELREIITHASYNVSSQKAGARKTGSARRSSRW